MGSKPQGSTNLVLTRKIDEGVVLRIGSVEIRVYLHSVKDPVTAQLRFVAPPSVEILRDELVAHGRDPGAQGPGVRK